MSAHRPAVFLDRDGTLMEEVEYCRDPALVRLLPGVHEGLLRLKEAGFALVIVTNQSGIGRGWITLAEYEAVQQRLLELLGPGVIERTFFCPDHPDYPTPRRKPGPEMLHEAARELGVSLPDSWMIGDKASDVHCALKAGVRPVLVETGYGALQMVPAETITAPDFQAATKAILRHAF